VSTLVQNKKFLDETNFPGQTVTHTQTGNFGAAFWMVDKLSDIFFQQINVEMQEILA